MNKLISVAAAKQMIADGKPLCVAGSELALDLLPAGAWIGGTSPYFMLNSGGTIIDDAHVFVTELGSLGKISFASYGIDDLAQISSAGPENGFGITVMPAGSACHTRFAAEAATYDFAFLRPTVGWIAGVHLKDLGTISPKVYDGRTAEKFDDRAVVAYVALPDDKLAVIDIVNLFEPEEGDLLRFHSTGFEVVTCLVNGHETNFADYLRKRGLQDGTLPLIGDYAGARINVSLQHVGESGGKVSLYAPVFPEVDYRFAKPVGDYASAFKARLSAQPVDGVAMSCNCILNFVFGELEGKTISTLEGPVAFGEIAYQLLNQTLVMVRIQ